MSKFTIDFTRNSYNGTIYDQKSAITLLYAGKYTPQLTIEITGGTTLIYAEEEAAKIGVPTYEVWSKTPSVKITAISPTGTFDVDASGVGEGHQSATVPAFTTTSATVYFKCSRSGSGSTCDPYRHNYSRPSVTITLDGIGYASQAVLNFGSDKHIYNGTTQTTGYSWTANGACARNIGYYKSRTAANDNKTPAGTLTCSILELTYNGVTYQVPLSTITINNPY